MHKINKTFQQQKQQLSIIQEHAVNVAYKVLLLRLV